MNLANYKFKLLPNQYLRYLYKSKQKIILFLVIVLAGISSLGTMPYGYRFAEIIKPYSQSLFYLLGIVFALSAAFANTALGGYSLYSINKKTAKINPLFLMSASFACAIPTGCMCFFAYHSILPFTLTLLLTIATLIINTGISYTAIINLILEFTQQDSELGKYTRLLIKIISLLIGILSSLAACMAAIHGLTVLFLSLSFNKALAVNLAEILGIGVWIPFVALYSNSTHIMVKEIVNFFINIRSKLNKFNMKLIILFIIALLAGSSFAEIAIEFFRPTMYIPIFLKNPFTQAIIHYVIVPLSYFANVGVNYLAMCNLTHQLIDKP